MILVKKKLKFFCPSFIYFLNFSPYVKLTTYVTYLSSYKNLMWLIFIAALVDTSLIYLFLFSDVDLSPLSSTTTTTTPLFHHPLSLSWLPPPQMHGQSEATLSTFPVDYAPGSDFGIFQTCAIDNLESIS